MTGRVSPEGEPRRIGIRGGTTTRTRSGMSRKNFWLSEEMSEALRCYAIDERPTETDLIREALSLFLERGG